MGCFFGCFGSSKDQKRKRQRYKVILRDQKPIIQKLVNADVSLGQTISNLFPESRRKIEAPLSLKRRKKVTFDTIVTTYEPIEVYDSTESLLEKNKKGKTFPKLAQDSIVLRTPNYRYGNCVESDDEFEGLDHEDDDDDDDDDDYNSSVWNTIESGEDKNDYVLALLNPVENLAQWQALKSKGKPLNFNVNKENLSMNMKPIKRDNWNQETALISSEKNTRKNKKPAC